MSDFGRRRSYGCRELLNEVEGRHLSLITLRGRQMWRHTFASNDIGTFVALITAYDYVCVKCKCFLSGNVGVRSIENSHWNKLEYISQFCLVLLCLSLCQRQFSIRIANQLIVKYFYKYMSTYISLALLPVFGVTGLWCAFRSYLPLSWRLLVHHLSQKSMALVIHFHRRYTSCISLKVIL